MGNLEKIDEMLEMYNLPRLNQEEIENMNRLMTSNEIKSVAKQKQKQNQKPKIQYQMASKVNPKPNI